MGIIFTARGWLGAEVEVYDGTNTEVYAVSGDVNNAYDVATALAAWLQDAARPWFGTLTSLTWGVDYFTPRVGFYFTTTGVSFSYSLNAEAGARISVTANQGSEEAGTTRGSCSAIPGMVMTDRRSSESGSRSRNTSWRMGQGLYAHRTPSVELALSLGETYAFCEAIRIAASPRTAYLYDEQSDSWSLWTIGRHSLGSHTDSDTTKTAGTLEVIGGA